MRRFALAVAGALFAATALTVVPAASQEGGGGGSLTRAAHCKEYKQMAMSTGEEHWWARWRQCMRGWN